MGTCGPFQYWASLTSLLALPSFVSIDSSSTSFTIDSSDFSMRGTYLVRLFGQSAAYPLA